MILDDIVKAKKLRLPEHKKLISEDEMRNMALNSKRQTISFYDALAGKGLSIIGEFKKASPSHGTMNSKVDLTLRIDQYNKAVDAISCLTEEDYFKGGVEYLKSIRSMSDLPIIRKDYDHIIKKAETKFMAEAIKEQKAFCEENGVDPDLVNIINAEREVENNGK